MSLTPTDWSVVVVGRWNRAILTPAGIAKRIFELPEATPVEVLLAIDAIAPPQVKHDGVVVVAGGDRLIVRPDTESYDQLEYSKELAQRALRSLRETPVAAVGINVNLMAAEPLTQVRDVIESAWDDNLSDANFEIAGRAVVRVIPWREGKLNLTLAEEESGAQSVKLNFERVSTNVEHHLEWLSTPIADIKTTVRTVLARCLYLPEEEIEDDRKIEPATNS